ncbi:GNAT family N-acetyltransferase [Pseudomonas defluvii]|uniref:GNAT family N-acetyltransferase n=1 Tax=Pseudomonas defluvii TaxID=1876757 RepID=UPI0039069D4B
MSLTHRPVVAADLALLCTFPQGPEELYFMFPKASFPLTEAQLQASIDQRADSTVVELNGRVVGFANFYEWERGGRCSIGNVIVDPEARGQGVARYLIEQMIAMAREHYQAKDVELSCFNQNTAGLLLYPQLGFVPYGIEERSNQRGERVALVQMRLQRA